MNSGVETRTFGIVDDCRCVDMSLENVKRFHCAQPERHSALLTKWVHARARATGSNG
jgi:hypothetical protein